MISTDHSGNVTYLNVVAERLTGWTCAEASGRRLQQVFPIIDAITRDTAEDPMVLQCRRIEPLASRQTACWCGVTAPSVPSRIQPRPSMTAVARSWAP